MAVRQWPNIRILLKRRNRFLYYFSLFFYMFTIDFNPTILEIGPFEIRWYGLFYLLGFILLYLTMRYCVKKQIFDLDKKMIDDFIFYVILGMIIGARIFYFAFYSIEELFSLELLKIWHGGMSFHGGLIGTIIAILIFSKRFKVNFWQYLNITAIIAILALMMGRIGNFINGELIGTPFNGPWCAIFTNYDNICRHPYPLYAALSHLLLFIYLIILIYIHRTDLKEYLNKKTITINFLIGYGILRIITDIWKVDYGLLGIKTGQWLSLCMIIAGLTIFFKYRKL